MGCDCPKSRTRSLEIIRLEAYNILSILRSRMQSTPSYSSTSNLVPILGSDTSSYKSNEINLIRKFRTLISNISTHSDNFLELEYIRPFLEILEGYDGKNANIVIATLETLSNLSKYDLLCFNPEVSHELLNTIFDSILSLFSKVVEQKEDFLIIKLLSCLEFLLLSKLGIFINANNITRMINLFIVLITIRNRNSIVRKFFHQKIVEILLASLNNEKTDEPDVFKNLSSKRTAIYLFISLLIMSMTNTNTFTLSIEDSYLSLADKQVLTEFRSTMLPIIQNAVTYQNFSNEFHDDICKIGLVTLNYSLEFNLLNLEDILDITPVIQTHITHSIYRLLFNDSIGIYSLVLRVFWNLFVNFRSYIKSQIEIFITHLLGTITNFISSSRCLIKPEIVDMNMEFILDLCKHPELLVEIYLNYDCDIRCSNIFDLLIKTLISCLTSFDDDNLTNTNNQQRTKRNIGKGSNKKKFVTSPQHRLSSHNIEGISWNYEIMGAYGIKKILKFLTSNDMEDSENRNSKLNSEIIEQKKWKDELSNAANIFNRSYAESEWISSIKELNLINNVENSNDIAIFIKYTPDLDLKRVGEYLGTHKNPEFIRSVLNNFAGLHCFSGLPVVMAIRYFLSSFRLPGESQQIERIIETFAKVYFESQPIKKVDCSSEEKDSPRWIILEKHYWELVYSQPNTNAAPVEYTPDTIGDINFVFQKYLISKDLVPLITRERFTKICESLNEINNLKSDMVVNEVNLEADNDVKETHIIHSSEIKTGFVSLENSDVIFVLAYSIIMLNTDLHNQQIKNKMKLEDFIRNNKGINGGKNLPFEFLEDIYLSIKNHEIKLHQNIELTDISSYDQHFWVDHVLERQKILGKYITDVSSDSFFIKEHLLKIFCHNNLVKFVNELFLNAKSVNELKQPIRIFWLLIRLGLKFKKYDLINTIFQLTSINVTYSLTYRCQISIAFIFNVLAVASDFFDFESWSKTMDIVLRLYCLNLLPMSFAAFDLDSRIYGMYEPLNDSLIAPSIRFKRNTDLKKNVGWLGGWTNFIPFNRTNSNTNDLNNQSALTCDKYLDNEELDMEDHHSLLFLFDVQSATKDILENRFFDAYLLRNKFSPIYSTEDEDAINEVTKALGNDVDKEELLPQVLSYMNMRLAFLNIYKLDDLFMGAVSLSSYPSFLYCLKVIILGIFKPNISDDSETVINENDTTSQEKTHMPKLGTVKMDVTPLNVGSILDPSQVVLNAFRDKIASIFNLGIFARIITFVLKDYKDINQGGNEDVLKKQKIVLAYTIRCFDILCKIFIIDTAIPHLPSLKYILKTFGLEDCEYGVIETSETHGPLNLEQSSKTLEKTNSVLYSHICTTLLRLILWFSENSSMNVDSSRESPDEKDSESLSVENMNKHTYVTTVFDIYHTMCAWLLHLIIHFENKVLSRHFDALAKVLYNLAGNQDILYDDYLVNLILCALQRIVNPHLPFYNSYEIASTHSRGQKRNDLHCSNGSIITLLLRGSKCLVDLDSSYIARTAAQTLLSMALFSKPLIDSKNGRPTKASDWSENLIAIQLLIEFKSFTNDNSTNIEYLWLLSLHCLSIIFSVGPIEVSNESIRGMNKLLLQESYPATKCTEITQIVRIFDYILAPMLTSKFQYPLPREHITLPLEEIMDSEPQNKNFWHIENPFMDINGCDTNIENDASDNIWMSDIIVKYLEECVNMDMEDISDRKASATNLICHTILSKLNILITGEIHNYEDISKHVGSNLECILQSSDGGKCSEFCLKQFIVIIQYVLNVIIPSNGEIHNGINRDTYLETLKNFILVLLTTPELKLAPEGCITHFYNDTELKNCLGILDGISDLEGVSPGEYVLSALLAHTLSVSDLLKDLFLDIMKVVFPSKEYDK
ncbi:Sec7 domain-containing protein [Theileria equi strain WA]|uniref:Sec7 domain-containing protein n=1 Tax=Theileria equi strain WA TaxID=1537102 RepID=L0B1K7_THEEQ|nr:Sec7 domain-containing protein [Theileria equi strain WA]AFZ81715.1 Sec7 domain-containing protein [Theileria equi strain WA]|eukprot:XP_004831381.1 Sec7 domain-containing protein [Theileria equi strain WA]